MRRNIFSTTIGSLVTLVIIQPLLLAVLALNPGVAQADLASAVAVTSAIPDGGPADDTITTNIATPDLADVASFLSGSPKISISPDDLNAIKQGKVDVRVTNYLLYLITPTYQGGAGLDYIKVGSIYQGHDTTGIGKYDNETLAANTDSPSQISAHNDGKAVDITQVGKVTCKLRSTGLLSVKTTWEPALPVKVAWQSVNGIANNPTPTGSSLVGVAGSMTAQSIVNYLNATGQLDAYVNYAKGLDIGTIGQYVGAAILLKNISPGSSSVDPLAGNFMVAAGTAVLQKALPNLPDNINAGNSDDDVRVSAAKAQIESNLSLPPGSISGWGWDGLLASTGKRVIERDLSLPTRYLDTNSLKDMNSLATTQAALNYATQGDMALNYPQGTVALLKKNDSTGIELAGVNVLSQAFKLSDTQKQTLITAVTSHKTANIDPTSINTGNQLTIDGITGLVSSDPTAQSKTTQELKNLGITIFQKAVQSAGSAPSLGVSQALLNQLLNPQSTISLHDMAMSLGTQSMLSTTNATTSSSVASNPSGGQAQAAFAIVASTYNSQFGLSGASALTAADIQNLQSGNNSALKKIGGAELDKAYGWSGGTGLGVINDPTTLTNALGQTMISKLGAAVGLKNLHIDPSKLTASKPAVDSFGTAAIEQGLALPDGSFADAPNASTLLGRIGADQFSSAFGINNLNNVNWDSVVLNTSWSNLDNNLNLPDGTTKAYLQGKTTGTSLASSAGNALVNDMSFYDLNAGFELDSDYAPDPGDQTTQKNNLANIKDYLKKNVSSDKAVPLLETYLGRNLDAKASVPAGEFEAVITAKSGQDRGTALLDIGRRLFARAIGSQAPNATEDDLKKLADNIKTFFNDPTANHPNEWNAFTTSNVNHLTDQFLNAVGVPAAYRSDLNAFVVGDYKTGLDIASSIVMQKQINQYLATKDQLSYSEIRDSIFGVNDVTLITKQKQAMDSAASLPAGTTTDDQARQALNKQADQNVQYKVADSFILKSGITIPSNFTKTMFTGTGEQKGAALIDFIFANIDKQVALALPGYKAGTLESMFENAISPGQGAIDLGSIGINSNGAKTTATVTSLSAAVGIAIGKSNISLGPLNAKDLSSIASYAVLGKGNGNSYLTDPQFNTTWGRLDSWVGNETGIAGLPAGISKSIFVAAQNNWDFNAKITNDKGTVLVPSVNTLATDFATAKITQWADKILKLPVGSVYSVYTAIQGVAKASQALAAANAAGASGSAAITAHANLARAQAALAAVVITTALNACSACQKFFSTIDQAIGAPPGFTNALAGGIIAASLGLGPTGLFVAAAIFLFGFSHTSYLCPTPPVDQYAVTSYDASNDQFTTGYTPGSGGPPVNKNSSTPGPGQDNWSWSGTGIPFTDGNKSSVWMGWSRYYTGKLIDATLNYGAAQSQANKPRQIITYRRANAEFFQAQISKIAAAFGPNEKGSSYLGIGYTQNSTKTTDWVHIGFGGI